MFTEALGSQQWKHILRGRNQDRALLVFFKALNIDAQTV